MRVLVSGATGFIGRAVTDAFLSAGHRVRALARPATDVTGLWDERVDVVRGDLRRPPPLEEVFEGVDALVHLAADVSGDEHDQFASTVVGTERLLTAMSRVATRRMVLASSIAVYDWRRAVGSLTEESPLYDGLGDNRGYAVAKTWQERVSRRMSAEHGFELTVLRPGVVWGGGDAHLTGAGRSMRRAHVVLGPARQMPITYVENCADCFVAATLVDRASGETFNVFDDEPVTAWRYMGEHLRRTATPGVRVPIPYVAGLGAATLAKRTTTLLFGPQGRLPSVLVPALFEASFKPLRFPNEKLRRVLGWRPPYTFDQALERSYGKVPLGDGAGPMARRR